MTATPAPRDMTVGELVERLLELPQHNAGAPSALVAYGEYDAAVLATLPVPGHYVPLTPRS